MHAIYNQIKRGMVGMCVLYRPIKYYEPAKTTATKMLHGFLCEFTVSVTMTNGKTIFTKSIVLNVCVWF